MSTAPPSEYLRLQQLIDWLGSYGIKKNEVLALIAVGTIKKRRLAGKKHFYIASQVQKDVLTT